MNHTLENPTTSASGNATDTVGAVANTTIATPKTIAAKAIVRTSTRCRCAAASAPIREPTLSTE